MGEKLAKEGRLPIAHMVKRGDVGPNRRSVLPLGQADLWVEFVEARKRYNEVSELSDTDPAAVTEAFDQVKAAYQRWSGICATLFRTRFTF